MSRKVKHKAMSLMAKSVRRFAQAKLGYGNSTCADLKAKTHSLRAQRKK